MSTPLRAELRIIFDPDAPVTQFDCVIKMFEALQSAGVGVSATVQPAPSTRRGRPAKINGGGDTPSPAGVSVTEVQTPPGAAIDQAQDEGDEEFGLASTSSLSPEEEREKALGICRNVYNADHREPIRALRKQFGVTKFPDIPLEQAHEFLRAAEAMAQKVGMRV